MENIFDTIKTVGVFCDTVPVGNMCACRVHKQAPDMPLTDCVVKIYGHKHHNGPICRSHIMLCIYIVSADCVNCSTIPNVAEKMAWASMSNCNFLNHWDVITHLTHALTLLWLNRRNFVRLHVWMSKYAPPFDNKVIIYLYPVINYRLANQSH